jgi:hypothetical protein
MPYFREFVMPLLTAIIVGLLVWAYLDRRLRNTLVFSNQLVGPSARDR